MARYGERVRFPATQGDPLEARVHHPAGRPVAWVLFADCFASGDDLRPARTIAEALVQRGLAVLHVDFTGLAEGRTGDPGASRAHPAVGDLVAAADFLRQRTGEGPRVLLGHSLAGAAVIAAARRIPESRAVATVGAPWDPTHATTWLQATPDAIRRARGAELHVGSRGFRVGLDLLDDLAGACLDRHLEKLGRPLLLLHSPQDGTVAIDNADRLYAAAWHPKSFVSVDGADHLLSDPADAAWVGATVAAWALRYVDVRRGDQVREPGASQADVHVTIGRDRFATEIVASGHRLVADEPFDVGGTDVGPSPYDLILSALGACTAMTLRMYADRKGWPLDAVQVDLRHRRLHGADCAECDDERRFLDVIERSVTMTGDLGASQRKRLLEIADRCPVHRTLEAGARIVTPEE